MAFPGLRDRLERLVTSDNPDVRAQAQALLSILALYENGPMDLIPAHQLYAIMTRHLIKDSDVIFYPARDARPGRPPHER